jgi:hypothetical protein
MEKKTKMQITTEQTVKAIFFAMFFWAGLFLLGKTAGHIHNHIDDIMNFIKKFV